jgi:hypothetical protein
MPTDFAPIADKVRAIIRMFSSDCDGDVLAAQRALMRLLKSNGCDIHVLADSIGNGKRFSEDDAAKIYRRGVADGRREAELAQRAPAFHDVEDSWESMVDACADRLDRFTSKEQQFLQSIQHWYGTPTPKQLDWLVALFERAREAA